MNQAFRQLGTNSLHAAWLIATIILTGASTASRAEPLSNAPPKEPTVITSDRLQVDYLNNVGTFEGNVLAVDPSLTVRADKMVVFYGMMAGTTGTNRTLERIVASGGVVLTQGERKATSEQAEYFAADGKVVLTGRPVLTSKDGQLSGEKITFWRQQEKVEVESQTRLILHPQELRKSSDVPPPLTTP